MVTFRRVKRNTDFSSPSLSASWTIFERFAKIYALKAAELQYLATKKEVEQAQQQVLATVLSLYLNLTQTQYQVALSEQRLRLLEQQRKRVEALVGTGATTKAELLQIEAQIAQEEAQKIRLEGQLKRLQLQLLQLLQLPTDKEYRFAGVVLDTTLADVVLPPLSVYQEEVLISAPQLQAASLRRSAAKYQLEQAKAARFPKLMLTATIGSSYSSNGGEIRFDPVTNQFIRTRTAYHEQIQDNFFQTVGVRLQIPVFTQYQFKSNIERSRLEYERQSLLWEQQKNELLQQLEQTYFDFLAEQRNYQAVLKQLQAASVSYRYTKEQYELGKVDFITYLQSLNAYQEALLQKRASLATLTLLYLQLQLYKNATIEHL